MFVRHGYRPPISSNKEPKPIGSTGYHQFGGLDLVNSTGTRFGLALVLYCGLFVQGSTPVPIAKRLSNAAQFRLRWPDRRPIGSLVIATAATEWATNPRGWFLDPAVNIQTPAGVAHFHERLIQWADRSILILKDMNAQGMVTWDIEGEQFSHPVTYVGDPTLCFELAPEMEGVADEYFARFRVAGLRVGLVVRPQQLKRVLSRARQEEVRDPAAQLIRKIGYAKQRWGATLFYIDSNGYPGWPLASDVIAKVAGEFPDVLLMPEEKNLFYYSTSAPYSELRKGAYSTPGFVRFIYPEAFSVINIADGPVEQHYSELVAATNRGDILMFRSWFLDPTNSLVKQIYERSLFKAQ